MLWSLSGGYSTIDCNHITAQSHITFNLHLSGLVSASSTGLTSHTSSITFQKTSHLMTLVWKGFLSSPKDIHYHRSRIIIDFTCHVEFWWFFINRWLWGRTWHCYQLTSDPGMIRWSVIERHVWIVCKTNHTLFREAIMTPTGYC